MNAGANLCPGCFLAKESLLQCPYCGYDEAERRTPLVLPHRTLLNKQYLVGKVLGKPGGFGITYLGWDINLNTRVAIKEYLPRDLAGRDLDQATVIAHSREDGDSFQYGLQEFLEEARTLARFDHGNIVRVRSFFEQNGTGYLVMDYIEGINLAEYVSLRGGKISEQDGVTIMMHIMDGLREVHSKGFLHRDIKPQNIFMTENGRPILLDFGAARQAMGERSRSLSVVLTPGFAPYEQYHRRGEQGPWTDIYACAATLYFVITGVTPPDAAERVAQDTLQPAHEIVPEISVQLSSVLMQGMLMDSSQRPQDVFIFFDLLAGKQELQPIASSSSPANFVTKKQISTPPVVPLRSQNRTPFIIVGIGVLALVVVAVLLFSKPSTVTQSPQETTRPQQTTKSGGEVKASDNKVPLTKIPSTKMVMENNTIKSSTKSATTDTSVNTQTNANPAVSTTVAPAVDNEDVLPQQDDSANSSNNQPTPKVTTEKPKQVKKKASGSLW